MTTPSASIFRAYDIRGIVTDTLTPDVVEQIGRAYGSECLAQNCKSAVVARDGRLSGPDLVAALSKGIASTGVDVIDIGMVPTPVLYFATHHLKTGTGVMVTGSHNPPEYNGLKMMIGGDALFGDGITGLYDRLVNNQLSSGEGKISSADVLDAYIERIVGDIKLERPIRVGIDCGNGVAGAVAPQLFKKLGCEAVEMFTDVDGTFPNHHPDPAKTENLQDLIKAVDENKLELGLAFDGDGDRVGVIDDKGEIIWPDRQMILYSRDIISRNPGALIIYDVKCSRLLPAAIEEAGGKAEMWKTGHSFIKARLKETGGLLGGEMSGHIFFKERWYGFDDALYSAARLLEIISRDSRPVSEIFGEIPDSVNTPELNISFAEGEHHKFISKFCETASFDGAKITTIDGLRADFADGWGLVRASNTTPSLVIRFEADNEAALKRIQDQFASAMKAVDADIKLPF
ncbi:phosphomannomutase/phosphoglucomutase [Granulosicoccaceae sp. 1_MG-2023]|nr:phosphomannomutase/phosphoglucomutase [Granulosicoccaceae sp. 1_MG-2023]